MTTNGATRSAEAARMSPAFRCASDFFVDADVEDEDVVCCTLCEATVRRRCSAKAETEAEAEGEAEEEGSTTDYTQAAEAGLLQHLFVHHYEVFRLRKTTEAPPSERENGRPRGLQASPPSARDHDRAVMTGYYLRGDGSAAYLAPQLPRPVPQRHEALIRVLRAGICGTDLAMLNQYKAGFQGVLGHEFVGIVTAIGHSDEDMGSDTEMATQWLGKRVVGEINVPCDNLESCAVCRAAHGPAPTQAHPLDHAAALIRRRNQCPHRQALGIVGRSGTLAEFITLPLRNLVVVPDLLVDAHAVFTEPLAAAWRLIEQRVVQPTDHVVVLGDGRLGLLVAETLAAERVAHSVTVIGKHDDKLALVAEVVDATLRLTPQMADTHRGAFTVCVECTGTPSGLALAVQLVSSSSSSSVKSHDRGRGHGRVVLKSTCAATTSPLPSCSEDVTVIGSRCGPMAPALALLASHRVDVQKYIEAVYPLARAPAAIAHAQRPGSRKVQVVMPPVDYQLCS